MSFNKIESYVQKLESQTILNTNDVKSIIEFIDSIKNAKEKLYFFQKLSPIYKFVANELDKANLTYKVAESYYNLFYYKKAVTYFSLSNIHYQSNLDILNQSRTLHGIGNCYYYLENYVSSLKYYTQSLILKEKINHTIGIVSIYINIAEINRRLKNYSNGLDYIEKSIQLVNIKENENIYYSLKMNLGTFYSDLQNNNEAIQNYKEALKYFRQRKSSLEICKLSYNIGIVLIRQKKYNQAIKHGIQIAKLARKKNYAIQEANALNLIGMGFSHKKNYTESIRYYIQAEEVYSTNKDNGHIINVYHNLCEAYFYTNQIQKSKEYAIKAILLSEKMSNCHTFKVVLEFIILEQINITSKLSFDINKKLVELYRKEAEEQLRANKIISKIQIEAVKKNQEEYFEKRIVELRQNALSAIMNPHFIFNSLNAIQYFINSNQKEKSSEYLAKLSRLVRLFLNHASESNILLSDEIDRLKRYVELEQIRFYPFLFEIEFHNDIDPSIIYIPNMILQPFIENSILHGVSHLENKDGSIKLCIEEQKNDTLLIKIIDNGYGLESIPYKESSHISKALTIIQERMRILQKQNPNKKYYIEYNTPNPNLKRKGYEVLIYLGLD